MLWSGRKSDGLCAAFIMANVSPELKALADAVCPGVAEDGIRQYCAAHGLTYIPPYNLRHTFVSLAKTMPEGTVKSLVGHSRQMDTFGVYAHLVNGEEQRTADQLEGVLKKVLSPGVQ